MMADLLALLVDEGKWLPFSMLVAALASFGFWSRHRESPAPPTSRIAAVLNLGAGLMVGTMAFGHLLAVAVKLALGTLREGSLLVFLAIGIGLLIPSYGVARHARALVGPRPIPPSQTVMLNAWLAGTLLVMGLHNLPLAAPSLLAAAYRLHSRPVVGWAIVGLTAFITLGLFAASLIFMASGQTFEQFREIR